MNDNDLINLYLERSEEAIKETVHTYGAYCNSIALRILGNAEDAEECMSDVCLRVWNAIPPESPRNFKGWLGTITRNCAITLCRKRDREPECIEEAALELSISLNGNPEADINTKVLGETINTFLLSLQKEARIVFLRRYWYGDTVEEAARHMHWSIAKTKTVLFRTRNQLKTYLEKEGLIHG